VQPKKIMITEADYGRLQRLIESSRRFRHRDAEHLEDLEQELERAAVVRSGQVPNDVVTMNSRVRIRDLSNGREATYQIVPGRCRRGEEPHFGASADREGAAWLPRRRNCRMSRAIGDATFPCSRR